jgi:hypothetical protein
VQRQEPKLGAWDVYFCYKAIVSRGDPAEKIDEMIASYEKLNREAHEMFDLYVDELRLTHPGIPIGSLKQLEITNPAGTTLNIPKALRILKERRGCC